MRGGGEACVRVLVSPRPTALVRLCLGPAPLSPLPLAPPSPDSSSQAKQSPPRSCPSHASTPGTLTSARPEPRGAAAAARAGTGALSAGAGRPWGEEEGAVPGPLQTRDWASGVGGERVGLPPHRPCLCAWHTGAAAAAVAQLLPLPRHLDLGAYLCGPARAGPRMRLGRSQRLSREPPLRPAKCTTRTPSRRRRRARRPGRV